MGRLTPARSTGRSWASPRLGCGGALAHRRAHDAVGCGSTRSQKALPPANGPVTAGPHPVLGSFLRRLQAEADGGVFLSPRVTTSVRCLLEPLCRGRFHETFFVDLPDAPERAEILALQLRERGRDASAFDLDGLAARTEGFSGRSRGCRGGPALDRAFADGAEPPTASSQTRPRPARPYRAPDQIARMRAWADGRAVFAGAAPHRLDDRSVTLPRHPRPGRCRTTGEERAGNGKVSAGHGVRRGVREGCVARPGQLTEGVARDRQAQAGAFTRPPHRSSFTNAREPLTIRTSGCQGVFFRAPVSPQPAARTTEEPSSRGPARRCQRPGGLEEERDTKCPSRRVP